MALLKRPSALAPLAMSLAALSLVLGHVPCTALRVSTTKAPPPMSGSY